MALLLLLLTSCVFPSDWTPPPKTVDADGWYTLYQEETAETKESEFFPWAPNGVVSIFSMARPAPLKDYSEVIGIDWEALAPPKEEEAPVKEELSGDELVFRAICITAVLIVCCLCVILAEHRKKDGL